MSQATYKYNINALKQLDTVKPTYKEPHYKEFQGITTDLHSSIFALLYSM